MKRLQPVMLFFLALLHTRPGKTQDSALKVAVVVSPALFMPVSVAVQAGVQVNLGRRWQTVVEGAYPAFYPTNTDYERIRYWRAGAELRYVYSRKPGWQRYTALQAAYLFRELANEDQGFYYTKTQTFSYTNAVIRSPVLSTALKLGVQLPAGRRFFVDAFAGAGVRFVFTSYNTKFPLLTSLVPKRQTFISYDDAWLYNYTLKRLHVVAGLRLGFQF